MQPIPIDLQRHLGDIETIKEMEREIDLDDPLAFHSSGHHGKNINPKSDIRFSRSDGCGYSGQLHPA